MMDNQAQLTVPDLEVHDTNKYKKHINDLIENAEIEAEIAAEKKYGQKTPGFF